MNLKFYKFIIIYHKNKIFNKNLIKNFNKNNYIIYIILLFYFLYNTIIFFNKFTLI